MSSETMMGTSNGEVDDASILANKETTKSYWESKLLEAAENQKNLLIKHIAADSLTPVITASVAQSASLATPKDSETGDMRQNGLSDESKELRGGVVSPPPGFRVDAKVIAEEEKPLQQYVYGANGPVESPVPRHVNIIEQEIREQQMREAALRQEGTLKISADDDESPDRNEFSEDSGCAEFQEFDPTEPIAVPKLVTVSTPVVIRPVSPIEEDTGIEPGTPVAGTDPGDELSPPSTYFDPSHFSTEAKIALEIRELKEREEELRRMRNRFQSSSLHSQDNLISLPTSSSTDEGNCSEYGSGEDASNKEVASIEGGGSSRLTSPEIPSSGLGFLHQRTQSMDSVSSGHSSTPSNGVAHPTSGMALSASYADFYSKRRVTVKPLADPEDEEESSYKPLKETPMEREIRLAREREEELRRIRAYQASFQPPKPETASSLTAQPKQAEKEKTSPSHGWDLSGKTEVKTLATTRIQQEIAEQEEREKSLLIHHMEKVEEVTEAPVEATAPVVEKEPLQRKVSTESEVKTPVSFKPSIGGAATMNRVNRRLASYAGLHKMMNPPGQHIGGSSTKGLMEKFLASRGKMTNMMPTFNPSVDPSARIRAAQQPAHKTEPLAKSASAAKVDDPAPAVSRRQVGGAAKQIMRRTYATAEEKIQLELQEMKQREKELREQRMKALARSQPNLLAAFEDEEAESSGDDASKKHSFPRLCDNELMNGGGIPQRCQSNPNLLDDDAASTTSDASFTASGTSQQIGTKGPRRKTALIAQWESLIQQQQPTVPEDN